MPATTTDYESIRQAQAKSRQYATEAAQVFAGSKIFADDVRERVRQARAERGTSRIAEDIGTTLGQLAQEGAEMRERTATVNPLDVDVLLARQRGETLGTLGRLSQLATEQEGTVDEILQAGVNRLVAEAEQKQAMAEMYAQEASDAMSLLKLQASLSTGGNELSINEALKLQEYFTGKQTDLTEAQAKLDDVQTAIDLLEGGSVNAGLLAGATLPLRAIFDKDAADFWRTSQRIATEEMFKIGGKVLPAQEIARLTPYLPVNLGKKSNEQILNDLKRLKIGLESNYQSLIGTPSFLPLTEQFSGLTDINQLMTGGGWQDLGVVQE